MVQPFNYQLQSADPFAGVLQGLKLGATFQDIEAARAANQQALALKSAQEQEIQAKINAQNRLATAASSLMDRIRNNTATAADFAEYRLIAPKDQSEAAGKIFEGMSKEQQQNSLSFGTQVMAALGSKDPQIGIAMLEERAAADNDPQMAKAWGNIAKLAKLDPANGVFIAGPLIASLPGGKDALDGWESLQRSRMEQEKFVPELDKAKAEAKKAEVELKYLDKEKEKALAKATSEADIKRVEAQYAERIKQANLRLTNAQTASQEASTRKTNLEVTKLKDEVANGPPPKFDAQAGGFIVAPTKDKPQGGFIPLVAAADSKQQQSAVRALKTAGYDVETGEDRISSLIRRSTSGPVQKFFADAIATLGTSTSGMEAINELQATANQIALDMLGGKLGAGISNPDREFIVGTLGDVGNPSKPAGERIAAWNAARNRMIVSGMLPPPTKGAGSAGKYENLSDAELMQRLGVTPARP
jgi:hypothetical protein